MLPHGSFPTKLVRHFFLHYDGRFEKCAPFICLLFNQLYRHLGLRKIASVATTNSKILRKIGELLKSKKFREQCQRASENPSSQESKNLNAYLMRIMGLFGNTMPFSSFERSKTRIRLKSLGQRFGCHSIFATVAPPEHDDVLLLKIELMRRASHSTRQTKIVKQQTEKSKSARIGRSCLWKQENRHD